MTTTLSGRRRRLSIVVNLALGAAAIVGGVLLIKPKIVALLDGSLEVIGVGAIANLALVFGGLMLLREAQRALGDAVLPPDGAVNDRERIG